MGGTTAQPHSDLPNTEFQDALLCEFERLGEEEVRMRLQFHLYDEKTVQRAHDWLADREYLQFGDDIRSVRTYARKTNDVAHDAIKMAQFAKQLVLEADTAAREAKETARKSNEISNAALAQLRQGAWINGLMLIIATVAFAISVGAVVFR